MSIKVINQIKGNKQSTPIVFTCKSIIVESDSKMKTIQTFKNVYSHALQRSRIKEQTNK